MPGTITFKPIKANLTGNTSRLLGMDPSSLFTVGETAPGERCRVEIKDSSSESPDGIIGSFEMDLHEIQTKGNVIKWYPVSHDGEYAGDILVEANYNPENKIDLHMDHSVPDSRVSDAGSPIDSLHVHAHAHVHKRNVKDEDLIEISLEELRQKEFAKEDLKTQLEEWANPQSFHVIKAGGRSILSKGEKALFLCSVAECNFRLYFMKEAHQEFFQLDEQKSINTHNHALVLKHMRGKLFTPAMEGTIKQLMGKLTFTLLTAHLNRIYGTNLLYRQVESKAADLHQLTFGTPSSDASRLMQKLIQIEREGNGVIRYDPDCMGRLMRLIYVSRRMKALFNQYNDIMLVDTTFSKNRFNMPILDIIGIDNEGHNVLFGFALLNNSKEETFNWAFQNFSEIMEKDPDVIFSDQEEALVNSLIKTFPAASHRLCGWHISRNLAQKFKYLSRSLEEKDNEMFKLIINLPFETKIGSFEDHVAELEGYPNITNIKDLHTSLKHKRKFAVCYIKHSFCGGINTTSRIEGIHGQLSHYINTKTNLQQLFDAFRTLEQAHADRFEGELPKVLHKTPPDPYLDWLSQIYSSYAIKKFAPLLQLHNSFKATQLLGRKMWQVQFRFESPPNMGKLDTDTYYVTLEDEKFSCDCQLSVFAGIPCVHELATCMSQGGNPKLLKFSPKWAKSNTVANLPADAKLPTVIEDYEEDELLKKLEETENLMNPIPIQKQHPKKIKRSAHEDRGGEKLDRPQGEVKMRKLNGQASVVMKYHGVSVGSQKKII